MADKRSTADNRGNGRKPEPGDRGAPVFEAWQLDLDPKLSADKAGLPSPGVWHWLGARETLDRYEIDGRAGDRVVPQALGRAMRGRSAKTEKEVRKPTSLTRDGKSAIGLRCLSGAYQPADGLAAECRAAATAERKEELRARLLGEAGAGIERLAGTDRFAAAAKVSGLGEGEDAAVRVEWLAFGAEREKGLGSPYDNRKARNFEAGVAKVSGYVAKTFGDRQQAEVEVPGDARLPGLLSSPVRDSLGANVDRIGVNAAENIRRRAEKKAKQHKLDRLPEADLRQLLANADNPFERMPAGPGADEEALGKWWSDNSDRIVLTTAVEGTLIAKNEKQFAELAQREVARRKELSPAPLPAVRQARGKRFAAEVGRRATVRTAELAALTEKERMARTRELHEKLKGVGMKGAELDDVAESVALQNLRNAHNEHGAGLSEQMEQPGPAAARDRVAKVPDPGLGID